MSKTFVLAGFLAVLPVIALGQDGDPRILTTPDAITMLQPVTNLNNVQPCGAESSYCLFDFENTTGEIIDSLTFDVTFTKGIPDTNPQDYSVDDPNNPASANCGGYFLTCGATIDGNTVAFTFSGVNPADGDETPGQPNYDPEIGEQEGIPPQGVFFIILEGWTSLGSDNFYDGVKFSNSFTTVPEASSAVILLTELLLLGGVLLIFRRKLNWKQRLDL
jgi:hypothetical protein